MADEVVAVGAKIAGRVEGIHVDLGDSVSAGEPLATIHQEDFELEVALAKAQHQQARAALGLKEEDPVEQLVPANAPPAREAKAVWDEAKAKSARLQQLRANNVVSVEEYEQSIAAEQVASARYASALNGVLEKIAQIKVRGAEIEVAQQRLRDTQVTAPFEGRVQARHLAPGTFVQIGEPIVTLVRWNRLRFRGTLPERHSQRLRIGQPVRLNVPDLEPIEARITRISPVVEQQVRSLIFEADVDNASGRLGVGLFVEGEVEIDSQAQAIIVPRSAVVEFAGTEKVWRVVDGVAREQRIRTVRRRDDWVEVAEGLASGDVILLDASQGSVARIDPTVVDVLAERRRATERSVNLTDQALKHSE
jgi:RND family efflux transporter MFP subunit